MSQNRFWPLCMHTPWLWPSLIIIQWVWPRLTVIPIPHGYDWFWPVVALRITDSDRNTIWFHKSHHFFVLKQNRFHSITGLDWRGGVIGNSFNTFLKRDLKSERGYIRLLTLSLLVIFNLTLNDTLDYIEILNSIQYVCVTVNSNVRRVTDPNLKVKAVREELTEFDRSLIATPRELYSIVFTSHINYTSDCVVDILSHKYKSTFWSSSIKDLGHGRLVYTGTADDAVSETEDTVCSRRYLWWGPLLFGGRGETSWRSNWRRSEGHLDTRHWWVSTPMRDLPFLQRRQHLLLLPHNRNV